MCSSCTDDIPHSLHAVERVAALDGVFFPPVSAPAAAPEPTPAVVDISVGEHGGKKKRKSPVHPSERVGQKFGKLTVLSVWRREKGYARALVRCDCGTEKEVAQNDIVKACGKGGTKSCGCASQTTILGTAIPRGTPPASGFVYVFVARPNEQFPLGEILHIGETSVVRGAITLRMNDHHKHSDFMPEAASVFFIEYPTKQLAKDAQDAMLRAQPTRVNKHVPKVKRLKKAPTTHTLADIVPVEIRSHTQVTDLTSRVYVRLTVRAFAGRNKHTQFMWWCVCECGVVTNVVGGGQLTGGKRIQSCGCLQRERVAAANTTHGLWASTPRLYDVHKSMMLRVRSARYRRKNIKVCPEWDGNPLAFCRHFNFGESPEGAIVVLRHLVETDPEFEVINPDDHQEAAPAPLR